MARTKQAATPPQAAAAERVEKREEAKEQAMKETGNVTLHPTLEVLVPVSRITVEFHAKIPTAPFGNMDIGMTWEAELSPELQSGFGPEKASAQLYKRMEAEAIQQLRDLAVAKRKQAQPILDKLERSDQQALLNYLGVFEVLSALQKSTGSPEAKKLRDVMIGLRQMVEGLCLGEEENSLEMYEASLQMVADVIDEALS